MKTDGAITVVTKLFFKDMEHAARSGFLKAYGLPADQDVVQMSICFFREYCLIIGYA